MLVKTLYTAQRGVVVYAVVVSECKVSESICQRSEHILVSQGQNPLPGDEKGQRMQTARREIACDVSYPPTVLVTR